MSHHHGAVREKDLSRGMAHLHHVPIQETATGSVHVGGVGAEHEKVAQAAHEQHLNQPTHGTSQSHYDWSSLGVNPDVVKINPQSTCSVMFNGREVTLGQVLRVDETQKEPQLNWSTSHSAAVASGSTPLYTVIMCDPDAPSRQDPKWRLFCHWIVCNVTSPSQLAHGTHLVKYMGPAPPADTGLHRYVVLVFAQKGHVDAGLFEKLLDNNRKEWSLEKFLHKHPQIDGPALVAGNAFQCQNEKQTHHESARPEHTPHTKGEEHLEKK